MTSTILIVDDDENVLDILNRSLSKHGYSVQTARGGKEALASFRERAPDMVILDMMLPDIDGREVLRCIRHSIEGNSVPVLFLSGNADLDMRLNGLEWGAEDYLVKPFSIHELNKKIDRALDRVYKTKELEETKHTLESEVLKEQAKYISLNKELKKQVLSMETLFSISQDLNRLLDMEELINGLALTIVGELQIASMALFALKGEGSEGLTLQGVKGLNKDQISDLVLDRKGSLADWLLKENKPKKIVRAPEKRWVVTLPDLRLAVFEYATPIILKQELIGIVFTGPKLNKKEYAKFELGILHSICNSAGIGLENARLFKQLQATYLSTVKTLVSIIEAKDAYTRGHTERVADYATAIAEHMQLTKEEKKLITFGAVLHDIGKLGVYENVLNKKGSLNDEEWSILKSHPEVGAGIIKNMEFLSGTVALVRHHHERYDGKGYPDHLKGDEIPLGARIITVADSFDAMTTDRPYRDALTLEQAIATLKEKSGSQFDPSIVKSFITVLEEG
ncbi:MAG: response regulator, partial [Chitinivibrionia bacterium]|nr:response regulator [Chitinivibrionia bacterium]